ncbi:phage protein Gp27 family protein [Xanthobacter sp. KR7-225]|uniref:phage protein Gp27 family protein n=1 Tax=Xanthobacter sp. KR7-225 TaxID=3156613 RepID=UPI0032B4CCE9
MTVRGRLNSMDLLPEEAADDVLWACQQLAQRKRTVSDIHFEFNDRLEAKGVTPVSRSAFYRAAATKAAAARRMQDRRAMFDGVASEFDAKDVDESTVILGEYIKTLIAELLADPDRSPKEALELARGFHATVSAQKVSTDRRVKIEAAAKAQLVKAVETAVDAVEQEGGKIDGAEVLRKIREDIYGIFDR